MRSFVSCLVVIFCAFCFSVVSGGCSTTSPDVKKAAWITDLEDSEKFIAGKKMNQAAVSFFVCVKKISKSDIQPSASQTKRMFSVWASILNAFSNKEIDQDLKIPGNDMDALDVSEFLLVLGKKSIGEDAPEVRAIDAALVEWRQMAKKKKGSGS